MLKLFKNVDKNQWYVILIFLLVLSLYSEIVLLIWRLVYVITPQTDFYMYVIT